jgi:hypothetical protein
MHLTHALAGSGRRRPVLRLLQIKVSPPRAAPRVDVTSVWLVPPEPSEDLNGAGIPLLAPAEQLSHAKSEWDRETLTFEGFRHIDGILANRS